MCPQEAANFIHMTDFSASKQSYFLAKGGQKNGEHELEYCKTTIFSKHKRTVVLVTNEAQHAKTCASLCKAKLQHSNDVRAQCLTPS